MMRTVGVGSLGLGLLFGLFAAVAAPRLAHAELPSQVAAAAPQTRRAVSGDVDAAVRTPADDELRALRASVERAEFQTAQPRLEALLAGPSLTAHEHALALELLAVIALAARRDADAQAALVALYTRDPEHRLSVGELGPQVSAAFERAARVGHVPAPLPIAAALGHAADGRSTLDVHLDDPTRTVAHLHAYVWFDAERLLSQLVSDGAPEVRYFLPAPPAAARSVAVVLEARAPSGALLASAGSPAQPIVLALPPAAPPEPCAAAAEDPPLRRRWWVWTSVGIAVAGIATASALATR
jgi:hypothetical protein